MSSLKFCEFSSLKAPINLVPELRYPLNKLNAATDFIHYHVISTLAPSAIKICKNMPNREYATPKTCVYTYCQLPIKWFKVLHELNIGDKNLNMSIYGGLDSSLFLEGSLGGKKGSWKVFKLLISFYLVPNWCLTKFGGSIINRQEQIFDFWA